MARGGFKVADIYADFSIDVDGPIGKAAARIKARAKDFEKSGESIGEAIGSGQDKGYQKSSKRTEDSAKKNANRIQAQFKALQFAAMFAGMPAAAAGAAALTVGALGAVPVAVIAYAATVVAQNDAVRSSFQSLAADVKGTMEGAASSFSDEFVASADQLHASFNRLRPEISDLFTSAEPDVAILTSAVSSLAERGFPGLVVAAHNSEQPLLAVRSAASGAGDAFTDMMTSLATGSTGAAQDIMIVSGAVDDLLRFVGQLGANLSNNGAGPLNLFRASLGQAESAVLTLTATGSAVYGFFNGFGASVNGMLTIVRGAAAVLSLIPDQITQFGGSMLATARVASMFGVNLGAAFDGLGDKVKGVKGLGEKLKTGFTGLAEGALSPTTLAVAALSVGLQILGQHQADAAAKAAAQADRERDLADALRESGGAIDANVTKTAAMALQNFNAGDGTRNLLADVKALAGNQGMSQLTQAYLGNKSAQDGLTATLLNNIRATVQQAGANDTVRGSLNTQIQLWAQGKGSLDDLSSSLDAFSDGTFGLTDAQKKQINSNVQLLDIMSQTNGTFAKSAADARDLANAMDASQGGYAGLTRAQTLAQNSAATLSTAFQALGDSTSQASDQVSALQTVIDTLTGRVPTHEEAIQNLNNTLRTMADQLGKNIDKSQGFGAALINADGTVNTVSANGSSLQDTLVTLQGGFAQAGQSINGLVAGGMSFQDATAKVNGELQTSRDRFIQQAQAMGLTQQQAQGLADKYGLIPAVVETGILQPGMLQAITSAGVLNSDVRAIPNSWTVTVSSLTQQAEANLTNLGFHVTHMPDGTVTVTAPNVGDVSHQIDQAARPRTAVITVDQRVVGGYAIGDHGASIGMHGPRAKGGLAGGPPYAPTIVKAATGGMLGNAYGGGMVRGPGTGTSDSVMLAASAREYVVNASATAQWLPLLQAINSGMRPSAPAPAAPGIDYGAMAAAVAQAVGAVLSAGVSASFDSTTLEKGLISLQRQRNRR